MIRLVDVSGLPTVDLADLGIPSGVNERSGIAGAEDAACSRCAVYRPEPQLSGTLVVDPEILLPSPGMDVDIAYYYTGTSTQNGPFGYGRTLTTNLTAQASGSPALVSYQDNGSGTFLAQTPGLLNTLVKD